MEPTENARRDRVVKYKSSSLARLRVAAGLTQKAVAAALEYRSVSLVSHWEIGQVLVPTAIMKRLAPLYGCSNFDMMKACVETWETGRVMTRHAARKAKLLGYINGDRVRRRVDRHAIPAQDARNGAGSADDTNQGGAS